MKTWTDAAKERLDAHLARRAAREGLSGGEAAEVMEDWRMHVQEELEQEEAEVVSVDVLEPVLRRLGEVDVADGRIGADAVTVARERQEERREIRRAAGAGLLWCFGVIFPAAVGIFEWTTSFCASVFFDPFRTWMHVVLVALVPVVVAWLLLSMRRGALPRPKLAALLAGLAMAVSLFYAWLFVPLIPASVIALLAWGMGLLSLMPIFAVLALLATARRVRETGVDRREWTVFWRRGLALGVLVLLALELGPFVTRVNLTRAVSDDEDRAGSGLAWLRFYHSEDSLLRACYEGNRGTTIATDISSWLVRGWEIPLLMLGGNDNFWRMDSVRVREVYYRVTGKPFNAAAPPRWARGGGLFGVGAGRTMEDFELDDHLGGEEVAVRVKGLSLAQSRMDGHVDVAAGLGYCEWTTVFRNVAAVAREARFQVQLPPGAVASRVTLWVNGEPREAAFASKAKVRAAYQEVAVRQQRDPVLVTACGPDRILVQCFPVPRDGGEMKIRVGITAPLVEGRMEFPKVLERNFKVTHGLEHAVWMQSDVPFAVAGAEGGEAVEDGGGYSCQIGVPYGELADKFVMANEGRAGERVYCIDPFASPEERVLTLTRGGRDLAPVDACVVVIDGSVGVAPRRGEIAKALEGLGERKNLTILVADDGVREIAPDAVRREKFSGGRDNVPALLEALRRARKVDDGVVVWVHAAQPLKSPKMSLMEQLYARGSKQVPLMSVPVAAGGNRVLEELFKYRAVQAGPSMRDLEGDLADYLEGFLGGRREVVHEWQRGADEPAGVARVSDQLARWWAATQVRDAYRMQTADADRVAFAAKYQIVTAYSGAVVLETAEQYKRAGLEPVDPTSVPNVPVVPEPGVWWLLVLAGMSGLWRRRR